MKLLKLNYLRSANNTLAVISGILEIGAIVYFFNSSHKIEVVLLLGLAYQMGNLLASWIAFRNRSLCTAALLMSLIGYSLVPSLLFGFAVVCLVSLLLQVTRRELAILHQTSTAEKRTFRIVGFLLAGFAGVAIFLVCIFLLLLISRMMPLSRKPLPNKVVRLNRLFFLMVIHQVHYFSYCYLVLSLFLTAYQAWAGVAFAAGWVTYTLAPKILAPYKYKIVVVVGHICVVLVLALIALFLTNTSIVLWLWLLSGFGGGTVYVIKRLNNVPELFTNLEVAEDFGHVAGVVTALVMWFCPHLLTTNFITAAIVTLITAICAAIYFKPKDYENSRNRS